MADDAEFVAFDTGIFWAGVYLRLPFGRNLSGQIVEMALEGCFCLVVLPRVIREYLLRAAEKGVRLEAEQRLHEFLVGCKHEPVYEKPLPDSLIEQRYLEFLPFVKDPPDAKIAVELFLAKPDYFIHGNPNDWKHSVSERMGVQIVTCREYLQAHGIPPHPPDPRIPPT